MQIGPYNVIAEIGRGGMATVYLAHDPRGQEVAVKTLAPELTHDPTFRSRFAREVATLRHLNHPAIVSILDQGEADGRPYLVMPYMAGGTLAERRARGRLGRQAAVRVFRRIAEALDYAHDRGVFHRAVKPGNIYFDLQGNSYLGDVGLVELASASRSLTHGGSVGTPEYMSPEQVKPVRPGARLDGRSDQYALGVVLYEMLAGTPPHKTETAIQQSMAHVLEPVPRIRQHNPELAGWGSRLGVRVRLWEEIGNSSTGGLLASDTAGCYALR
jgi:serine/threonine-protein kinase